MGLLTTCNVKLIQIDDDLIQCVKTNERRFVEQNALMSATESASIARSEPLKGGYLEGCLSL